MDLYVIKFLGLFVPRFGLVLIIRVLSCAVFLHKSAYKYIIIVVTFDSYNFMGSLIFCSFLTLMVEMASSGVFK